MMKDLSRLSAETLKAEDILSVPETEPERLFRPGVSEIAARYREIAKSWHPDRKPGDAKMAKVFIHATRLKEAANEKFRKGTWLKEGEVQFTAEATGKLSTLRYAKKKNFELGEMYIAEGHVAYAVKKEFRDLFDNAKKALSGLQYADDRMKKECARYVPEIKSVIETQDRLVMVLKKDPALVALSDLQEAVGGKIEPKHAAWILSTMENAACFLSYNKLAHGGISRDTYFVDPEGHTGAVMGGWWYAAKQGSALKGLPGETINVVPPDVLDSGLADMRVDLMLIRHAGRAMLGDPAGMKITRDKDVPKALSDWLTLPPEETAFKDYKNWTQKVLPESFGARRYVKMDKTYRDIYKP